MDIENKTKKELFEFELWKHAQRLITTFEYGSEEVEITRKIDNKKIKSKFFVHR
jgi:hypothetical protein